MDNGLSLLVRPGFTFVDELQEFCWLTESSYHIVETRLGKCFVVRVPDYVFYEYHSELFLSLCNSMESYC